MKQGFTLLELLVTAVLIAIVGMIGGGVYSRVRQNEDMTAVVIQAVQLVNSGRVKSVTGDEDMGWRVRLEADIVELVDEAGTVWESYQLPDKYSLLGPVTEISFGRGDGRVEECETGCVFEVRETEGSLDYQFRVLYSGIVEY